MNDPALLAFLAWAAPRLGLRLRGIAHFRRTIGKRLVRRFAELGIGGLEDYRVALDGDPGEWTALAAMCRIPISRLYRDHAMWDRLAAEILPERARLARSEGREVVRVWSAGCASGEEPYSVAMIWRVNIAPSHPEARLEVMATDADEDILARARRGEYGRGSLRELPARLRDPCLQPAGTLLRVDDACRAAVTFRCQDLRRARPEGMFDVILCRNVLLTYIEEQAHAPLLAEIAAQLLPDGALVVGARESMPADSIRAGVTSAFALLEPWPAQRTAEPRPLAGVYRRIRAPR